MTPDGQILKIVRPDDWHSHFRDDEMLKAVLPYTSLVFGRAIAMPNLIPPITTRSHARAYRDRILNAVPADHSFVPLMTCYLTADTDVNELTKGFQQGVFSAAKLYPANATTNSCHGITDISSSYPIFERMQKLVMPLLIHAETTDATIDIFDREAWFIEQSLEPVRRRFPELKIVLEHITTKEAVQYVLESNPFTGATITPQHLMFNRNHMLSTGIRPHLFCFPVLKRSIHQDALRQAIASGSERFFLGTDSAPHTRQHKQSACGCIFNAPSAISTYAQVFEEMNALPYLEAFCSLNGPRFYGLPVNQSTITLVKAPITIPEEVRVGNESIVPFLAGQRVNWSVQ